MVDDLQDTISDNAQGPASASGDSGSMRQHGLRDQIAADRYMAGKDAVANRTKKTMGIRMVKLVPPGAV